MIKLTELTIHRPCLASPYSDPFPDEINLCPSALSLGMPSVASPQFGSCGISSHIGYLENNIPLINTIFMIKASLHHTGVGNGRVK